MSLFLAKHDDGCEGDVVSNELDASDVVGDGLESNASVMLMNEDVSIAEETTVLTFKSDVCDVAFVVARNEHPSSPRSLAR